MTCWSVTDDLDLLINSVNDMEIAASDADDLVNTLMGIRSLSELRFKKLFETFEYLLKTAQLKYSE